jgi:cell wall-associated NlpC family hydrolase
LQRTRARQIRRLLRMKQMRWLAKVFFAFFLMLALALPAAASKKRSQKRKAAPKKENPASGNYVNPALSEDSLANEMLKHLGVQYRPGGSSPNGVDCSGYVGMVYRNAYGMELPHQSGSLYASSDLEKIQMDELKTGDLLFFTSSKKGKKINHVGIYLSEREFVHAATGKGVVVSSLDQRYWSERIAGARRVTDKPQRIYGATDPTFEFASTFQEVESSYSSSGPGSFLDWSGAHSGPEFNSHFLELGFGSDLAFNVSFSRESFFSLSGTAVDSEDLFAREIASAERPLSASVQGVRLEKPIRPNDWLVVTPFLSYFNYEGGIDETGLPRRSVGVDVSFGSVKDGWKVSTGFKYLSLIPSKGFSDEERTLDGYDMSLSYSKRVTDSLSISFIGERLQRYEAPLADLPQQDRLIDDQRFSILFNFTY